VRIVAGSSKGVRLAPVPDGVRPLSDRAREGLFSSLGPDRLVGATVLDLYAGTGATGIEAISRGAELVTFVERSVEAAATIHRNLSLAHTEDRSTVHTVDVLTFLRNHGQQASPFDLVFCDPPYATGPPELDDVLAELMRGWVVEEGSTVVLTRGDRSSMPVIPVHWTIARQLRYGDSLVHLIRPVAGPLEQVENLP
jgi:16S rRNA (guanine966-N2)-methyltransferase